MRQGGESEVVVPDRAAEGLTYRYGFPTLIVVLVGLGVLLAVLLPGLTRALLEVASAARGATNAVRDRSVAERREAGEAEERAEARHREAMALGRATLAAVGDVKGAVGARL